MLTRIGSVVPERVGVERGGVFFGGCCIEGLKVFGLYGNEASFDGAKIRLRRRQGPTLWGRNQDFAGLGGGLFGGGSWGETQLEGRSVVLVCFDFLFFLSGWPWRGGPCPKGFNT